MKRIQVILGVVAVMAMMLVAFVAPAMAQTNQFGDSDRYGFVISSDSNWNDWNDYNDAYYYPNDEYLEDLEDAYEDYEDKVEDYLEDYEGSYWGFNSYYYW